MTKRWLRVAELLQEHSSTVRHGRCEEGVLSVWSRGISLCVCQAKLVLCILPFPRDYTHAKDFMSLLEVLSQNMPPMVSRSFVDLRTQPAQRV